MRRRIPGQWKTGQRVSVTDHYVDQHGFVSHHEAHCTFPPCIGRKGECAYRVRLADWQQGTRPQAV
jgi:hypothetical protein